MDIDEVVETAGIHTHNRLTGDSRSSGVGGDDGNDSWTCRLLRCGWDLTRKAAIAGAAVTAAPVVAPPLIVLSAAGVALSVPFAAYLASLAATNHLMDALLRSCYPPTTQPYYHQEDADLQREFLDASEEYGQGGAPTFGHLGTETEQGGKNEGDTLLLLPRDHGVSEALAPAFADDEVEEEEEEGGISAQESGQESYEREEHTPVEGKEALPRDFGVSASAKPLSSDEDSLVQNKGEGLFSVLDSGQQPFQPDNWNEKGDGMYSRNKEDDGEENKSTKETVSQGLYVPESRVPASGGDDNLVQKRGEGKFSVQNSGQPSFQPKNWNEKQGEDGKRSDVDEDDKDNVDVLREKEEGEFSEQNLGQYSLLSSIGDKKEQGMTMEENKSTEEMPPQDNVVSEDNVVQSKEGFEGTVQGVMEEANSDTDIAMGEVAEVQVEIIAISAPESEVLPLSSLAALESQAVAETAHVAEVKNEKGISMEEKKSTDDMPPRDFIVSESPGSVFLGKDNVVQSQEGFQGTIRGVVEEANSNTELVMGELADVQLQIISIAAPETESEVLPPIDLVAHELRAVELVAGEAVDVQVSIVAAAAPGNEVLHPSVLATSESTADAVIGETVDVQVDVGSIQRKKCQTMESMLFRCYV